MSEVCTGGSPHSHLLWGIVLLLKELGHLGGSCLYKITCGAFLRKGPCLGHASVKRECTP